MGQHKHMQKEHGCSHTHTHTVCPSLNVHLPPSIPCIRAQIQVFIKTTSATWERVGTMSCVCVCVHVCVRACVHVCACVQACAQVHTHECVCFAIVIHVLSSTALLLPPWNSADGLQLINKCHCCPPPPPFHLFCFPSLVLHDLQNFHRWVQTGIWRVQSSWRLVLPQSEMLLSETPVWNSKQMTLGSKHSMCNSLCVSLSLCLCLSVTISLSHTHTLSLSLYLALCLFLSTSVHLCLSVSLSIHTFTLFAFRLKASVYIYCPQKAQSNWHNCSRHRSLKTVS